MRLKLTFHLDKPELPIDNKSIWISFFKNVLSHCGKSILFEKYFGSNPIKDYCFSVVLPKPEFKKDIIKLAGNEISMIFSSDDSQKSGLLFFAAFIEARDEKFFLPNGNAMVLKQIVQLKEAQIHSSKILFKTVIGGGVLVRKHEKTTNRDQFLTFNDPGFNEAFIQILRYECEKAGLSRECASDIVLTPVHTKKVVVKQYGIFVDVSVGSFWLEGDPRLLQYIYKAGLGSKCSMGYGLLDVVAQIDV